MDEERPNKMNNGYFVGFNKWAFDKNIRTDLGLLLIISSLCAEKGYCYASNPYLSELFKVDESTISRKLKNLENNGYITIEYFKRGCEIISRYIRLTEMPFDDLQKCQSTIDENAKENNTSINNINNNKKENIKRKSSFIRPTVQEIENYIQEKKLNVDARQFFDYFEAGDWTDSKGNKVKNWKQKLLTWHKFQGGKYNSTNQQKQEFNKDIDSSMLEGLYDNL